MWSMAHLITLDQDETPLAENVTCGPHSIRKTDATTHSFLSGPATNQCTTTTVCVGTQPRRQISNAERSTANLGQTSTQVEFATNAEEPVLGKTPLQLGQTSVGWACMTMPMRTKTTTI